MGINTQSLTQRTTAKIPVTGEDGEDHTDLLPSFAVRRKSLRSRREGKRSVLTVPKRSEEPFFTIVAETGLTF